MWDGIDIEPYDEINDDFCTTESEGEPWVSDAGGPLPATIWYHFTYKFTLAKISFRTRRDFKAQTDKTWNSVPKVFDVVGSNDCENWHVLKSVSDSGFTAFDQMKSWEIPCEKQKSFSCYGIRATEAIRSASTKYVSLQDIQMYKL